MNENKKIIIAATFLVLAAIVVGIAVANAYNASINASNPYGTNNNYAPYTNSNPYGSMGSSNSYSSYSNTAPYGNGDSNYGQGTGRMGGMGGMGGSAMRMGMP